MKNKETQLKYNLDINNNKYVIILEFNQNLYELKSVEYLNTVDKYLTKIKTKLIELLTENKNPNDTKNCNFKSTSINDNYYFIEHKDFIEKTLVDFIKDNNIININIFLEEKNEKN